MYLSEGIKTIGRCAFQGCTSINSLDFPDSLGSIQFSAFQGCTALTSLVIPNGVQSLEHDCFNGCTNIISLSLGSSLEIIGQSAFNSLIKLKGEITIPDSVKTIEILAFNNCQKVTKFIINNNSQLKTIGNGAFMSCIALKEINIPDSIETIGSSAFKSSGDKNTGCVITSISKKLKTIGDRAFYMSRINSEISLPDSCTSIGSEAFFGSWISGTLDIGDGVQTIGSMAFYSCRVNKVVIGDSLKTITGNPFSLSNGISEIEVSEDNNYFTSLDNKCLCDKNITRVIKYVSQSSDTSYSIPDTVTTIEPYAFSGLQNMTTLEIPSSVTTIGGGAVCALLNLDTIIVHSPNAVFNTIKYNTYTHKAIEPYIYKSNNTTYNIVTFYGYPGSTTETYCKNNNYDFEKIYNTESGKEVLTGSSIEKDASDSGLLGNYNLRNLLTLGVQRKGKADSKDIRFVQVINSDMAKDAVEYGFIVGKTTNPVSNTTTFANNNADKLTYESVEDGKAAKFDCTGTDNNISGDFGVYATTTPYKYVTLAVEDVPDDVTLAMRFYVKDKDGNIWYSRYEKDTTYYNKANKALASNWTALNSASN